MPYIPSAMDFTLTICMDQQRAAVVWLHGISMVTESYGDLHTILYNHMHAYTCTHTYIYVRNTYYVHTHSHVHTKITGVLSSGDSHGIHTLYYILTQQTLNTLSLVALVLDIV